MWPLTIKLPDTSGFIASPPVLERTNEDPTVFLGLWAPIPHACGLVECRSAYSSHAFQPHPTLPVIPQPREEPSFWLTADTSFSLLLFPCIVCWLTFRKGILPPRRQTGYFPRAASCKHGITSLPVSTTGGKVWVCGDRVGITGMPQLFFRLAASFHRLCLGGTSGTHGGTWPTPHRATKRLFPDYSFHGTLKGSTVHPLSSSAGQFSPWIWERCKKSRSALALLKALVP